VNAGLIIDNSAKTGYCASSGYEYTLSIVIASGQTHSSMILPNGFIDGGTGGNSTNGSGPAGGTHWPVIIPTACGAIDPSVNSIIAGTPSTEPTPGYSYYTSFVTSSQNCLYYLTQSNQFVVDRAVSSYVANNYEPVFQSTSDNPWPASKLEKVVRLDFKYPVDKFEIMTKSGLFEFK
jgi:hypothetical protein